MMKKTVPVIVLLLLAACSSENPDIGAKPVYCANAEECNVKWARALAWVKVNSSYDIQTQNDTLIKTLGPDPHSPYSAVTIKRQALGHGLSRIVMASECYDIFQCIPPGATLQTSFVQKVDPDQNPNWPRPQSLPVVPVPVPAQ